MFAPRFTPTEPVSDTAPADTIGGASTVTVPVVTLTPPTVVVTPRSVVTPVPAVCVKLPAVTAPSRFTFAALVTVTDVSGVRLPTARVLMLPVPAVSVSDCAPFTVLFSTMFPAPAAPVLNSTGPARSTARLSCRFASPVTMSPARLLVPAPFCRNAPVEKMSPAAAVVNNPAFVTVTVPPAVTAAFTVSALPVNDRLPVKSTAPPKVVVPVPADCVRLVAVIAPAVTLPADTTVKAPRRVVPPTAPDSVIFPVPAAKLRF